MSHYVPTAVVVREQKLRVRWMRCSPAEFREPFFSQTEARLRDEGLAETVKETSTGGPAWPVRGKAHRPNGFIYHMSRCGSTLVGNLLARVPRTLVLSEPPALSSLLDECGDRLGAGPNGHVPEIRALVQAFGAWSAGHVDRFFIKCTSQNIQHIQSIREAVRDVPELFLYRDPLDVVLLNISSPAQSWMWHPKNNGLSPEAAWERPVPELFARTLGRTMQAMIDRLQDSTLLLNYSELGDSAPKRLLDWIGVPPTETVLRAMTSALRVDAKDALGAKLFKAQLDDRRRAASPMILDCVEEFARSPYRALEAIRLKRASVLTTI